MIRVAYLRVYVPADRAPGWSRHASDAHSVRAVGDSFLWSESMGEDAFSTTWDGEPYVCPRYPKLRILEGMLAFTNAYPRFGELMVPEAVVQNAAGQLALIKAESPEARSYILASPWHVPLRWFAAFDPAERELVERPDGITIRYRTAIGSARRRLERAVTVLDNAGFEDGVVEPARDVLHWVSEFAEDAMLELDYGRVVELFSEGDLALDDSCEDVNASLEALESGNFERAGLRYASVAGRWAEAQSLTYVN